MFCGAVDEVTSTRMLVAPVYRAMIVQAKDKIGRIRRFKASADNKALQLVIYANTIRMNKNPIEMDGISRTAMVLPFPIRRGVKNRVAILDMSYDNVFDDLDALFERDSVSVDILTRNPNGTRPDNMLPIRNVGSYIVSICSDIDDLSKVDSVAFAGVNGLIKFAKQYYPRGFGFIVCNLRFGAQYRPFAYCHELREDGKLFVPLRRCFTASTERCAQQKIDKESFGSTDDGLLDYYQSVLLGDTSLEMNEMNEVNEVNEMNLDDHVLRFTHESGKISSTNCVWDHIVYIINRPYLDKAQKPMQTKFDVLYTFLNSNLIPRKITFGKIRAIQRIYLGKKRANNTDLYI